MTPEEMAALLLRVAALENRAVEDWWLDSWFEVCGHVDFHDAREGVIRYHAESSKWMTPHRLLEWAAAARDRRLTREGANRPALQNPVVPPASPETAREMAERIRQDLAARRVKSDPPDEAATG